MKYEYDFSYGNENPLGKPETFTSLFIHFSNVGKMKGEMKESTIPELTK